MAETSTYVTERDQAFLNYAERLRLQVEYDLPKEKNFDDKTKERFAIFANSVADDIETLVRTGSAHPKINCSYSL